MIVAPWWTYAGVHHLLGGCVCPPRVILTENFNCFSGLNHTFHPPSPIPTLAARKGFILNGTSCHDNNPVLKGNFPNFFQIRLKSVTNVLSKSAICIIYLLYTTTPLCAFMAVTLNKVENIEVLCLWHLISQIINAD